VSVYDIVGMSSMLVGFVALGLYDLLRGKRWRLMRGVLAVVTIVAIIVGIVAAVLAWIV
jgi:hypothetical protein